MQKPTKTQATITLLISVLTALSGYLGWDKYEQMQAPAAVTVNVEAPEAQPEILNREQVMVLIGEAIAQNNKHIQSTYKKLESWEK